MARSKPHVISDAGLCKLVREPQTLISLETWAEVFRRGLWTVMKKGCPMRRVPEIAAAVDEILGRGHPYRSGNVKVQTFDEAVIEGARGIEDWARSGMQHIEKERRHLESLALSVPNLGKYRKGPWLWQK